MDKTTNAFFLKDDLQHNMKLSSCCGRYISANATTTTTVTSCSRTRDKHERNEYTREMSTRGKWCYAFLGTMMTTARELKKTTRFYDCLTHVHTDAIQNFVFLPLFHAFSHWCGKKVIVLILVLRILKLLGYKLRISGSSTNQLSPLC